MLNSVRITILVALAGLIFSLWMIMDWSEASGASAAPAELRIGFLPDQGQDARRNLYDALAQHLTRRVGVPCRFVTRNSYEELVASFGRGELEMAWFGGLTFVQAHRLCGAEPLVMRDRDVRFTSVFICRSDDPRTQLTEFSGERFAFGSRQSTSGHLMPRFFMQESGLVPEKTFARVLYSGRHERTLEMVATGEADLGVANQAIFEKTTLDPRPQKRALKVVSTTPPYVDYVWAVQRELHRSTTKKLLDAFLQLDHASEADAAILSALRCQSFLPASLSDFQRIEQIGEELGLLEPKR